MYKTKILWLFAIMIIISCTNNSDKAEEIREFPLQFMTIDPGHFHAALVQKSMYDQLSPVVHIYAPDGPDIQNHMKRIEGFNKREENPTNWEIVVYTGDDFLQQMIEEQPGNVMITAGNNEKKTEYIKAAVDAGINVLADKPMAINKEDFALLVKAFESAEKNQVLLYDIMTERYEITTLLQKELSQIPEIFGQLLKGSPEEPAISKESVHHFFKYVSGNRLQRPAWFFDVRQEGEGIVDVTTHLVDLIQWECFPDQIIDYTTDIEMLAAKRWATELTPGQFNTVTGLDEYPEYLQKDIHDSVLIVFCNGEIIYKIKDVHAKVSVTWNYQAPEGAGDTHYSIMRGSSADLIIKQGAEQNYKPALYIKPVVTEKPEQFETSLLIQFQKLADKYPGIALKKNGNSWEVLIPDEYRSGHEAHFTEVTKKYLDFLIDGKLPEWEVPNMIAKYYITTQALELAKENK